MSTSRCVTSNATLQSTAAASPRAALRPNPATPHTPLKEKKLRVRVNDTREEYAMPHPNQSNPFAIKTAKTDAPMIPSTLPYERNTILLSTPGADRARNNPWFIVKKPYGVWVRILGVLDGFDLDGGNPKLFGLRTHEISLSPNPDCNSEGRSYVSKCL